MAEEVSKQIEVDTEVISKQLIVDNEHLNLLSLFHLISGIFTLVYSVFMALYFGFVTFILNMGNKLNAANSDFPFEFMNAIMFVFTIVLFIAIILGVAKIFCSKFIKQKTNRVFCIVICCIECFSFPYGTLLGVLSIMVLNRNSVKEIYND